MARLIALSCAVGMLLASRIALAAPVLITFEGIPGGTTIINQFAQQGVTFNQVICINEAVQTGIPDFAHSGVNAIEQCFAQEFCTLPVAIDFTAAQRQVKLWAGFEFGSEQTITVILTAFNGQGASVGQATTVFPPQLGPRPIRAPLEVLSEAPAIRRVEVTTLVDGQPAGTLFLALDDLEFDTEGPPPVCPATAPPAVTLLQPLPTTTTEINSFILQGFVSTTDLLTEATMTITHPDGSTRTGDLLSSHLVQRTAGPFGPTHVSPLAPGLNRIKVRAANCFGAREAESQVTYNPIAPGTKLLLKNLEVTQTIQDLSNSVPLIAGKPTVARAYLMTINPPGGTIHNLSGTMSAFLTDGSLPGGPVSIRSSNAITVVDASQPQILTNLATTLNFELPPEWTHGLVHLQITSLSINGIPISPLVLPCQGCSDPVVFRSPRAIFEDAPPLRLVVFGVPYATTDAFGNPATFMPAQTHFDHLFSWLRRTYPTADVQVVQSQLCPLTGRPKVDFTCDDVNALLSQLLTLCRGSSPPGNCGGAAAPQTHFYGLVADTRGFLRGCSNGIPSRVASGPAGVSAFPWDTDGSYADWYGGHELAHTYDRRHPGFCSGNSEDDDDFPYSAGHIGGNGIGFDFGDSTLGIARALFSPGVATDIMTYCDFEWMSDYTYKGILHRLRAIEASGSGGGLLADGLLAQGTVNLTRGLTRLRPFLRLEGLKETPRPTSSNFSMELRNAAGAVLATYLLEMTTDTEALPEEDRLLFFDVVVPYVNGTRSIVILQGATELATRTVTRSAPQVELVTPNGPNVIQPGRGIVRVGWEAADTDGETLAFTLFYSNDNGVSWEPLETGLTELRVDIPVSRLRGGEEVLFRILATDGVNTAQDDQDAPMRIAQRLPRATIFTPEDNATVPHGQVVLLRGTGQDLEDGALGDASLEWASDVQGVLGQGPSLSASLEPGLHLITLSATDSAGATDSALVQVQVLPAPLVAQADVAPVVPVGAAAALDGSASSGEGVLSFDWSILSKPAGSTASVTNAAQAVASLVPDRVGAYSLQLLVTDPAGQSSLAFPSFQAVTAIPFVRGETTSDARLDISDPVRVLGWLFTGSAEPVCLKAADANDDGSVDLSDAVQVLTFLFSGGRAPVAPFPQCGVDSSPDTLTCLGRTCP